MQINIENLSKQFDEQTVLSNIDLNLENIHSLVLIGPSGGGKTTLLRILAGLEFPNSGTVSINQKQLQFEEDWLREYRKTIGVVFQSYNLFPHLTALENVTLPLIKVHHYKPDLAKDTAMTLFKRFQLEEHVHKIPAQLSGGQKQRTAIIRALSIKPQFLMMDEPTSALDPALTAEVLDMILQLRSEKIDLILITHEIGFAQQLAEQVLFLSNGSIVEKGKASDLFKNPQSQELNQFLNSTIKYNN